MDAEKVNSSVFLLVGAGKDIEPVKLCTSTLVMKMKGNPGFPEKMAVKNYAYVV